MKISVVINSYNQVSTLERTILSVISQTAEKEVILVDAGSTDGSIDLINKYRSKLDKIIINHRVDLGQSHAINLGFTNSSGDVLCWINSDDWYEENAFEVVNSYFEKINDPFAWLIASCNLYNEDEGKVFSIKRVNGIDLGVVFEYGSLFWIPQQSSFWRRDLFFKAGPLTVSDHVTMDVELFLKFVAISKPIIASEVVANYSFHGKSKGSVYRKESFVSQNKLRIRYSELYKIYFQQLGFNVENIPIHFKRSLQSDLRRMVKHVRG